MNRKTKITKIAQSIFDNKEQLLLAFQTQTKNLFIGFTIFKIVEIFYREKLS